MLSDESSSDSETGRFKSGNSERKNDPKSTEKRDDKWRTERKRPTDSERMHRDLNRRRNDKDRYERRSRERYRYPRHSPARRRHSRERSHEKRRRSPDRPKLLQSSRIRSGSRHRRSNSRDKRHSRSRSHKSPDHKRSHISSREPNITSVGRHDERIRHHESPDYKNKRSVIQKPKPEEVKKRKSVSPIDVDKQLASDASDEVQPGSYYSMIPAVVKEKSAEIEISGDSTEIDSSDDERLRAKLLNLEKELKKNRKKKHKKKHKKKSSKSEKERDTSASVEVTSTTDIQEKEKNKDDSKDCEIVEVTSTQKSHQKESSEEGEISSDDSQKSIDINPNDLRHKLKRSVVKNRDETDSPDLRDRLQNKSDVCGPALPPHLRERFSKSASPDVEGPALPPHLTKSGRNIGPSIPNEMRKVLAETDRDIVKYVSSDEDGIGPLPAGAEEKWTDAHQKLEERALDIKIKKMDGHSLQSREVKSREQWMLELPEAKAKFIGLEARSFRAKEGPDMTDRSSWTDTPEQKALKEAGMAPQEDTTISLRKEAEAMHIKKRDEEQEKEAKKHKKKHKRDESLLELHQKKLKKKKKKEDKDDEKKERRPFSRDVDLQVNRFDEAQKKAIIKKAQALDSRFSKGEAKYL